MVDNHSSYCKSEILLSFLRTEAIKKKKKTQRLNELGNSYCRTKYHNSPQGKETFTNMIKTLIVFTSIID